MQRFSSLVNFFVDVSSHDDDLNSQRSLSWTPIEHWILDDSLCDIFKRRKEIWMYEQRKQYEANWGNTLSLKNTLFWPFTYWSTGLSANWLVNVKRLGGRIFIQKGIFLEIFLLFHSWGLLGPVSLTLKMEKKVKIYS